MKKNNEFACIECGQDYSKWKGRCHACLAWNSILEIDKKKSFPASDNTVTKVNKLKDISVEINNRHKTGLDEIDRVLGGGLIKSSLVLLSGKPGVGKSTLLLTLAENFLINNKNENVLYITGEESSEQVAGRAKRLLINNENLYVANLSIWEEIYPQVQYINPKLLILDSIQTTYSQEMGATPGSIGQIKKITYEILEKIKTKGITTILIAHITKEGNVAGPKLLEHMVDVVLSFEARQQTGERVLRATKNRFGDTAEIGLMELSKNGLKEVNCFDMNRKNIRNHNKYGNAHLCTIEGTRVVVTEVQALVNSADEGRGKRITLGYDGNRLTVIVAILEKYLNLPLEQSDIYINCVGVSGSLLRNADVAIAASIISSYYLKEIDVENIFTGEIDRKSTRLNSSHIL